MINSKSIINNSGISFGTSGARGLVSDFTPEVCAAFTASFISVAKKKFKFGEIAIAIDNRPSSMQIAKYCISVLNSLKIKPIFFGCIPTPALAYSSLRKEIPSIMVTGSHIPFDRNGLKFYMPDGEISKSDEYEIINEETFLEETHSVTHLEIDNSAAEHYISRYVSLYDDNSLKGYRIGIYEHSSAGRDLYGKIFSSLGAEVIPLDRSDTFIPIDTEAVSNEDIHKAKVWSQEFKLDAIFSTDGDGDRPLLADDNGRWFRGDILGILASRELGIESVVTPINCNSIVQYIDDFKIVELTKIGSPYVIEKMNDLQKTQNKIAGFEANGGYLLGSDIFINNKKLNALPTRDSVLPVICLLASKKFRKLSDYYTSLPKRFTHSDRLQNIPDSKTKEIFNSIFFTPKEFINSLIEDDVEIVKINQTDGSRFHLSNEDIIHIRKSGNAPELRCYVESNTPTQAKELTSKILNSLKRILN